MTPASTRPALPKLDAALAAFRRVLQEAAQPVYRGPNPHTETWSTLVTYRAGQYALGELARACGPRVTLRQPVTHWCYGRDCQGLGRVIGGLDDRWTLLNVEWACGRYDWLQADTLRLLEPGTAWEAENAAIGAALRGRLAGVRA